MSDDDDDDDDVSSLICAIVVVVVVELSVYSRIARLGSASSKAYTLGILVIIAT